MVQPATNYFHRRHFNGIQTSGRQRELSHIYWEAEGFPGLIAVAVGSFADPAFPAPAHSVCERRRHHWVEAAFGMPLNIQTETLPEANKQETAGTDLISLK
jgi:hypothetical protein